MQRRKHLATIVRTRIATVQATTQVTVTVTWWPAIKYSNYCCNWYLQLCICYIFSSCSFCSSFFSPLPESPRLLCSYFSGLTCFNVTLATKFNYDTPSHSVRATVIVLCCGLFSLFILILMQSVVSEIFFFF